jgi:hypothetical protein
MKSAESIELALLEAEARRTTSHDIYERLLHLGVPPEIVYRLSRLWRFVRRVGERIISVGKILLIKIAEFVEQNPALCAGVAIGAALSFWAAHLPIIGPLVGPLTAFVTIPLGAATGYAIDASKVGDPAFANVIRAARKFFALLVDLLGAVIKGFCSNLDSESSVVQAPLRMADSEAL